MNALTQKDVQLFLQLHWRFKRNDLHVTAEPRKQIDSDFPANNIKCVSIPMYAADSALRTNLLHFIISYRFTPEVSWTFRYENSL